MGTGADEAAFKKEKFAAVFACIRANSCSSVKARHAPAAVQWGDVLKGWITGVSRRPSPTTSRPSCARSTFNRVLPSQPPYAVAPTEFRFPALAALAGRAQLGGDREVALAMYVTARLVQDSVGAGCLGDAARLERAANAKTWVSSFALPGPARQSIIHLIESTAGDTASLVEDLRAVVASARPYLDIQSQAELDRLAKSIASVRATPT
jgi:hypothetical protein